MVGAAVAELAFQPVRRRCDIFVKRNRSCYNMRGRRNFSMNGGERSSRIYLMLPKIQDSQPLKGYQIHLLFYFLKSRILNSIFVTILLWRSSRSPTPPLSLSLSAEHWWREWRWWVTFFCIITMSFELILLTLGFLLLHSNILITTQTFLPLSGGRIKENYQSMLLGT